MKRELPPMARWALARISALVLVASLLFSAVGAEADARTDFLRRMLETSSQFRVRVQAALALGGLKPEPAIVKTLSRALGDKHPAVRSAAAAALGRLGDRSALGALKNAANKDSDRKVRAAVQRAIKSLEGGQGGGGPAPPDRATPAIYYVGVGVPGTTAGIAREELQRLRGYLARIVGEVDGVVLAPNDESRTAAARVIRSRNLVGCYVDSSVTKIENKPGGAVRATVSVIVGSYPERNIGAMLQGSATVSGSRVSRVQAIEAAFKGAIRGLPRALATQRAKAAMR